MKVKVSIAGCPKLNLVDYGVKLTEILKENNIKSITLLRMEVSCCGGLERTAATELKNSGETDISFQIEIITIDGQ